METTNFKPDLQNQFPAQFKEEFESSKLKKNS